MNVFAILIALSAWAQEPAVIPPVETIPAVAPLPVEQPLPVIEHSGTRRASQSYFIFGEYSLPDLLVPSKFGVTGGWIQDGNRTWELEYLKGSVSVPLGIADLGSMSDKRISLTKRSYFGFQTFNLSYGIAYYDFSINIGDDILNRIPAVNVPNLNLLQIKGWGLHVGVGHRWVFRNNMSLGVDWFSWSQPLMITERETKILDYVNNSEDRDRVTKAVDMIAHFPRFSAFKVQFGLLF